MRSLRVTLVNPPHQAHALGDEKEIAPPLGLLRLASPLMASGHPVRIEDLNLLWHTDLALRSDFFARATDRILADSPDLVGLTSMAVDTHVAILLAGEIKARAPDTVVVLGGPHATQIADEVQRRWTAVDRVIGGYGAGTLTALANTLGRFPRGARRLAVVREFEPGPSMAAPDDGDWDFRSAYALVDWSDYFQATGRRHANIEGGRGCRFRCSFCYSPEYHHGWSAHTFDSVLAELDYLQAVGVDDVFFVEDNFVNDPVWSVEMARQIGACFPEMLWSCYATLPTLGPGLLTELGAGGCRAIFSGVDALTPIARRTYHKSFARHVGPVAEMVGEAGKNQIIPTLAFLVAPPSHPTGLEFDATVIAAASLQALDIDGVRVRLNVLAHYPGTGMHEHNERWAPDTTRAELLMDVCEEVRENPLAPTAPHLFPFHNRYVDAEEWNAFISRAFVVYTLVDARPQSVLDLQGMHGYTPSVIAYSVLEALPPLGALPKNLRRTLVVEEFDSMYHAPQPTRLLP